MLAYVTSFGRNPRGSPDFLAYPVPKACRHVLGTRVPRCLGVARSASEGIYDTGRHIDRGPSITFSLLPVPGAPAATPSPGPAAS